MVRSRACSEARRGIVEKLILHGVDFAQMRMAVFEDSGARGTVRVQTQIDGITLHEYKLGRACIQTCTRIHTFTHTFAKT